MAYELAQAIVDLVEQSHSDSKGDCMHYIKEWFQLYTTS